ncbi:MAG: RHS repeat-associated core domain-containing protein [Janthinobacterium lividum]
MEKKYVPAGVFLACDKGSLPSQLSVTFNANTSIYGQCLATEADKITGVHVKPMGACAVSQGPCVPAPQLWDPVKNDVVVGNNRLLLEDSKLQCSVGGRASIFFSLADAQAACPAAPPEKSLLDKADDYLATLGPAGDYARFQMGMAEGLYAGGKSMAEGLWGLAKGGWHAATHPIATAQAVGHAANAAADWASKGENWSNAANAAGNGIGSAADWASHGDNWGKAWDGASDWASKQSPRDWGKIGGRATFEVAMAVGTGGAGEAVNAAGKVGEAANLVEKGAEAVNLTEKGLEAANLAEKAGELGNAAGKAEVVGKVTTGAEEATEAARAAKAAEEAAAAEKAAQEAEAVEGAAKDKRVCENDPIDVATGDMLFDAVDVELPGPIPFIWERTWYSTSRRRGPLGHGWHHCYDQVLWCGPTGAIHLRLADGRLATFEAPSVANDFCSYHRGEQLELRPAIEEPGSYAVFSRRARLYYHFAPVGSLAKTGVHSLRSIENGYGNVIHFAYDAPGRLHLITDSAGRRISVRTDAQDRIVALDLPRADGTPGTFTAVQYAYDEAGNMQIVADAEGQTAHFAYSGHLMVQKTFRNGLNVWFEYDTHQRCIRTWGDENYYNGRFVYELGKTTLYSEAPVATREYFHTNGLVTKYINPVGSVQEWYYNAHSELELARDSLGQVTSYDYDSVGNLVRTTYPNGATEQLLYNDQGQLVASTDAAGGTWQWLYNENKQLTARIDSQGATTRYTYDLQHQLSSLTDALGGITRLSYDAQHNLACVVSADGSIKARTYDALGRLVAFTDALGNVQHSRYNRLGHLVEVREPDGSTRQFAYNASGKLVRATVGLRVAEYGYTLGGQLAWSRQNGQQVNYAYDREGRLEQIRNQYGETYLFYLDAAGQVAEEVGFDGLTRRYVRDAAGRIVEVQRPAGRTTQYTYDAAGRVTQIMHNGTERTSYRYRADGALLEAVAEAATVEFERDVQGRVLRETHNGVTVESSYDLLGQRASLRSTLGAEISFAHDAMGQVLRVRTDEWQSIIERDAKGLKLHRQLSGGVRISWQRDQLGRPTSQRLTAAGRQAERRHRYHWGGTNQLLALEDSLQGTTSFAYDEQGYLAAAAYADDTQELRQVNRDGNSFRDQTQGGRRYGRGGQLLEANGTRYQYDDEGNLIRRTLPNADVWRYTWNGYGQLLSVTRPEGYTVTFTYDAMGRRLSKRFRGRVTRWAWDGNKPLHEWQELEIGPEAGSVSDLSTWLFEEDSFAPMAKLTAQGAQSIMCDYLGTPTTMYNSQGEPTWEVVLDGSGQVRLGKGRAQDCPFRYQGQYEDVETGLYYNRFRYYDPQIGQYISQDPIRLRGGMSFYAYVPDPLHLIDPLGLVPTYGPLDAMGRPTGVSAELTLADLRPTGTSPPTIDPPGWLGGNHPFHQQRSHLLADTLGGSGSDARNLVTLTDGANHPGMSSVEGQMRRYIRANPNSTVLLEVKPHYVGNSLVPDRVTMYALDHNGNVLVDRTISNGLRQNTVCRGLGC